MARGFLTTTTGTKIDDVVTRIGFLSTMAARIARVHEFGTVSKGGTLPDIRGKPFLRVPVRSLNAALGAAGGYVMLRKVSIPPRLGFRAYMAAALRSGQLEKAIVQGIAKTLSTGRAA